MLKRRDFDYVVIVLLIGGSIYVFVTGLIADTMGLHQFAFHSEAGYLWVSLAVVHLLQTWNRVTAFVKNRFRSRTPKTPAMTTQPQATATAVASQQSAKPPTTQTLLTGNRRNFLWFLLAIATGIGMNRFLAAATPINLPEGVQDVGMLYHKWSQPGYGETIATVLNWGEKPEQYKTYPQATQIQLPAPLLPAMNLAEAINARRSQRTYNDRPLTLATLSSLLHLAQGITHPNGEYRAVPSSGALYPLETYAIVHNIDGLETGIYHHAILPHALEQMKVGNFREPLVRAGLSQDHLGTAGVCFVISGIFQRARWKYHERTYRYVLIESGHLGQNLYLAATALGLGVCGIGAFFDDPLNQLLELDGQEEAALYLLTVGSV